MESRLDEVVTRKNSGYNCAQSVACGYCELAGLDEELVKSMNQGYAVGMGASTLGTCGAIVGAINILGAINAKNGTPRKTMRSAKNIITKFQEQNGTVICRELKGIDDGIVKRECLDCVKDAAKLLEAELEG